MDDRALLEAAARAAGIDAWWSGPFSHMLLRSDGNRYWNPLTDDGDALRLAVKLRLLESSWLGDMGDEPGSYAATRRAIVRAAAALQETKNG